MRNFFLVVAARLIAIPEFLFVGVANFVLTFASVFAGMRGEIEGVIERNNKQLRLKKREEKMLAKQERAVDGWVKTIEKNL